jgi:hypothetical protein
VAGPRAHFSPNATQMLERRILKAHDDMSSAMTNQQECKDHITVNTQLALIKAVILPSRDAKN